MNKGLNIARASGPKAWGVSRLLFTACLCVWSSAVLAQKAAGVPAPSDATAEVAPVEVGNLRTKTDAELTALTAQWEALAPSERRALLAEVRGRMLRNQKRSQSLRLRPSIARQYGRVKRTRPPNEAMATQPSGNGQVAPQQELNRPASGVVRRTVRLRQPDGSIITRTEVVRLGPDGKPVSLQARVTFGAGFEKRARDSVQSASKPAVPSPNETSSASQPLTTVSESQANNPPATQP